MFRADEEQSAGNIRTDMFQELFLADLVFVDLSIDNPNVWYELGVYTLEALEKFSAPKYYIMS